MTDRILVIVASGLGGLQSVGSSTIFGDAVTCKIVAPRSALGDIHLPKPAHGEVDEDDRDHGGPDQRGGKLDGAG